MGQLNQMQRYAISLMLKGKKTQSAIEETIGVNKSTVSRELWQKGLIENTNMLIRQYIPRNENFSRLTNEQVAAIQYKINRRPRKKLGFRIPYQEFYLSLQT